MWFRPVQSWYSPNIIFDTDSAPALMRGTQSRGVYFFFLRKRERKIVITIFKIVMLYLTFSFVSFMTAYANMSQPP